MVSTLEATAPCRLELIGGPLGGEAAGGMDGVLRLSVALDRRVFCRVEPREAGVEIHSKDTGERVTAEDAREIVSGAVGGVARILEAAGLRSGVRVVTQVRVPEDTGLGTAGALEVAVLAALGLGAPVILEHALLAAGATESDRHAALFGGAHVLWRRAGAIHVERVKTDPARLEECLLLVDPGLGEDASATPSAGGDGEAVVEALERGGYDDVAALLAKVHRGCFDSASPAVRTLAASVAQAGGAAWPSGRLVAVWAAPGAHAPGAREAVSAALKAAGLRSFPARADLRGLEVE